MRLTGIESNTVDTVNINGKDYVSLRDMAKLLDRTPESIRNLLVEGNRYRKMKFDRFHNSIFIPVTEIVEYPFSLPGRAKTFIYRYAIREGTVRNYVQKVEDYEKEMQHTAKYGSERDE